SADTVLLRLASDPRVAAQELPAGSEVGMAEVGIEGVFVGPALVDVDAARNDGISGEDVGQAPGLVVSPRLLERHGPRQGLVARRGTAVEPADDLDHGVSRQYGELPPSIGNMQPVMLRPASEASRTATAATSSTVFGRLMAESSV